MANSPIRIKEANIVLNLPVHPMLVIRAMTVLALKPDMTVILVIALI
jgi:hypothetical protein